jgi:hypothetical protein
MSEYLSTIGRSRIAIGICGRCSLKFALDDLSPDVNYPGLLVCGRPGSMSGPGAWTGGNGCSDMYDPYRLPPRETEDITLEYARPDDPIVTISVAPGSALWPPSEFEDDGLQAPQEPSDGYDTFPSASPPPPPPPPPPLDSWTADSSVTADSMFYTADG